MYIHDALVDVLKGQSSFRLYEQLPQKIAKLGAKYPAIVPNVNGKLEKVSRLVRNLPSRVEVRDPETKEEQWYSNETGVALLQSMVEALKSSSIEVDMSRDASTHNIQFNLSGGYCLDFPANFPKLMPLLFDSRGQKIHVKYNYNEAAGYCNMVASAVRQKIQGGNGGRYDNQR